MESKSTDEKSIRISLFSRIILRLTLPLFFLGTIFTATQLTNQIKALNELHRFEGQWAFPSIYQSMIEKMGDSEKLKTDGTLQNHLRDLSLRYPIADLGIFDALEERPLFESSLPWGEADRSAIQESLREQKKGAPYFIKVNKKARQLLAYMPLSSADSPQIYIARAVLPLAGIKEALAKSAFTLGAMVFFIFITGIIIAVGLARSIIHPIRVLNEAAREMMSGRLGLHVAIKTGDEIEELAHTFNKMSDAMREMKLRAEDSNPLTGLPGNKSIFAELQKRIHERQKFVFFHADLDRFKVFNDHYGLAKGDLAIKKTAEILRKVVGERGNPDDFFGHQGGDDFVVITRPNRAEALGAEICQRFNSEVVPALYSKEDFQRGFTLHIDRRRQAETGEEVMRQFPLLSVSLAGVSSAKKDFADYLECMNVVSEVKKEVKKKIESCYFIQE